MAEAPQYNHPSLMQLLGLSVRLFFNNFPLLYAVMAFYALIGLLMPNNVAVNIQHWAFWVLIGGIALLSYLFKAGWNLMMDNVLIKQVPDLGRKPYPQVLEKMVRNDALSSFGVLKDFLPGIAQYGLGFLIAGVVELVAIVLPFIAAALLAKHWVGVPQQFVLLLFKMMNAPEVSYLKMESMLHSLPEQQLIAVSMWMLLLSVGGLLSLLLQLLLLFWQPCTKRNGGNGLLGLWQSVQLFWQRPLIAAGTVFLWIMIQMMVFMPALIHPLVAMVCEFLMMTAIMVVGIWLYAIVQCYGPEKLKFIPQSAPSSRFDQTV